MMRIRIALLLVVASASLASVALAQLPAVVVCEPHPAELRRTWKVVSFPTPDSVVAECRQVCAGHWSTCISPAHGSDQWGQRFQRLFYTVDGLPGGIRWNQAHPTLGQTRTNMLFSGGGGIEWLDENEFWRRFDDDGVRTVAVRWHPAIPNYETGSGFGFLSDNDGAPSTVVERTERPAAVIQWVHDNLSNGTQLGTVGTSGGSVATWGAVFWHGLDDIIDYQLMIGGPVSFDLDAACEGRVGVYGPTIESPICEHAPDIPCASDADCGPNNKCAFPNRLDAYAIVDYVHRTGNNCELGNAHPSYASSSARFTGGDWEIDHPIDIKIQEGGDPDGDDTLRGNTYAAAQIYLEIVSAEKTYEDLDGWYHGSVIHDPAFQDYLECTVNNGLGLGAAGSCTPPTP